MLVGLGKFFKMIPNQPVYHSTTWILLAKSNQRQVDTLNCFQFSIKLKHMLCTHIFKIFIRKHLPQIVGFLKTSRFLSYSATVTLSQIFPGATTEKVFVHLEFKGLWRTLLAEETEWQRNQQDIQKHSKRILYLNNKNEIY